MEPGRHPRMLGWYNDNPVDPGRPALDDPDVRRLSADIAPGSRASDLGGVMSLNAWLEPAGLVLRVHRPFVTRQRLLAVQEVRCRLAAHGLLVPVPIPHDETTVLRCGRRWAELEGFIPHERAEPMPETFVSMFASMGALHRVLAEINLPVPRPPVAIYAPPGTLRRWLPITESAVRGDPEAAVAACHLRELTGRLRRQWVSTSRLPVHLVHGDMHLSNVCRTPGGEDAYLDFGFLARRPRIHEIAYSLSWTIFALDGHLALDRFDWTMIPQLVAAYESAAGTVLTAVERAALVPYTAAAPLYHAAIAGFTSDPVAHLKAELPYIRLSEWLLAHPEALMG